MCHCGTAIVMSANVPFWLVVLVKKINQQLMPVFSENMQSKTLIWSCQRWWIWFKFRAMATQQGKLVNHFQLAQSETLKGLFNDSCARREGVALMLRLLKFEPPSVNCLTLYTQESTLHCSWVCQLWNCHEAIVITATRHNYSTKTFYSQCGEKW